MSNTISRLVVVAIGLPIVLGVAWLGGWWMFALVLGAATVALDELYRAGREFRPLTLAGMAGLVACLVGVQLGGLGWMTAGALLTLPLAFVFVVYAETRQRATVSLAFTVLGVVWIGMGLGHIVLVRAIPEDGRLAIFTVLIAVFAADSGAYLVGRLAGRHKLAPSLSPGKSWEGFLGGCAAGIFATWIALYDEDFASGWKSIVLGLAIVVAAALGDLMQSLVKRDVGIKDSGRLLAGHGGVWDRVDSLLVAVPTAFYVLAGLGEVTI
jgi:phosphatidate cytidylyltransferase